MEVLFFNLSLIEQICAIRAFPQEPSARAGDYYRRVRLVLLELRDRLAYAGPSCSDFSFMYLCSRDSCVMNAAT